MTAITEKATLGQQVTFDATLSRVRTQGKRYWEEVKCDTQKGVVVGSRTLWDGEVYTEHFDEEDGGGYHTIFMQDKHFTALLIAFAMNRKPVLVPVSAVTAL
jgi:hypothetical protein